MQSSGSDGEKWGATTPVELLVGIAKAGLAGGVASILCAVVGVALLFAPVVILPLLACVFIGSTRRALGVRRVARHPSSRVRRHAAAARRALYDSAVALAMSATGAVLTVGTLLRSPDDIALAFLFKVAIVLLVAGAMVRHTRAMQGERMARVARSLSQRRDRRAIAFLLKQLETFLPARGLPDWVLGTGAPGPSPLFTAWWALSLIAALGVGGHVNTAAELALFAVPDETAESLLSAADRMRPLRRFPPPQGVRGPGGTLPSGGYGPRERADGPEAEDVCRFDPEGRLRDGVDPAVGDALYRAWRQAGAIEGGCPRPPHRVGALWLAELDRGKSPGSLVVSSLDGRAAVVYGPAARAVGLPGAEGVVAVGPRLEVGSGDAHLVELGDGGCRLVARASKREPYVFLPPAVTVVVAWHEVRALPAGRVGEAYDFVAADGSRFSVEFHGASGRARLAGSGPAWVEPTQSCPRDRLARFLAR